MLLNPRIWLIPALIIGGGIAGYQVNEYFWLKKEIKLIEGYEEARIKDERLISEFEKKYLKEVKNVKVVSHEVIKEIPTYINTNDCKLSDHGLQRINSALRGESQ